MDGRSSEVTSRKKTVPMNNQKEVSGAAVNPSSASVRRRMDLHNPPDENKMIDESHSQVEYLDMSFFHL